jgi:hypothetical protein
MQRLGLASSLYHRFNGLFPEVILSLLVTCGLNMASETGSASRVKTEVSPLVRWAGFIGIAGVIIWWVTATVLGFLWPTYSAVSDPISLLAAVGAPHAIIQQLNFYTFGASILILSVGLFVWTDKGWRLLVGAPFLVVFGIGVIVAGFFQYNPNNLQATTSQYHNLASLVTFPTAILGVSLTSWGINHDERWPSYPNRFVPLGIAILAVSLLVVFMMSIQSPWEGLTQRLFLLVLTGWIAYHGYELWTLGRG